MVVYLPLVHCLGDPLCFPYLLQTNTPDQLHNSNHRILHDDLLRMEGRPIIPTRRRRRKMKTREQIEERIETLKEVIVFAKLIRLDTVAVANLGSFINILE